MDIQRESNGALRRIRVTPGVWREELREDFYDSNAEGIFSFRGEDYSFVGPVIKLTEINVNLEIDYEEYLDDEDDFFYGELQKYIINNSTGNFMMALGNSCRYSYNR
ncbi:MAG: hypothetical protein GY915_07230 [bacterium]|nr:hypothetical protein [bacterium]